MAVSDSISVYDNAAMVRVEENGPLRRVYTELCDTFLGCSSCMLFSLLKSAPSVILSRHRSALLAINTDGTTGLRFTTEQCRKWMIFQAVILQLVITTVDVVLLMRGTVRACDPRTHAELDCSLCTIQQVASTARRAIDHTPRRDRLPVLQPRQSYSTAWV